MLLLIAACSSIYETGSDQRAEWDIDPLNAANSSADEVAPVQGPHGLYFTSNREVANEELDRLYLLPFDASSTAGVSPLRSSANDIKSGAMVFRPGPEPLLYYVECYRSDGEGDCDLVEGRLSSDGLSIEHIKPLGAGINDIEWDHHPSLSADGKTLVFASERFGGSGGSDLWISKAGDKGWSAPVNIGGPVNTSGNEITPCLSPSGQELYFASDALPGRGGFDIYLSRLIAGKWSVPEPLGLPFNSGDDDVFFNGSLSGDTIYLASNRVGGKGGFDIYRVSGKVIAPPPPPPPPPPKEKQLVLRVRAKNSYTMENIPAVVSISSTVDDRLLAEGNGDVESPLDLNKYYTATGELSGFISAVETVRFGTVDEVTKLSHDEGERMVITHDLLMVPTAEEERKIYAFTVEFDFNLFNIRPEEERKLDSVVILLTKFPNSTVVFSGHTDSLGTVIYNIKLGYSRAKEVSQYVKDWLYQKGVTLRNPLELRTYGEAEPRESNSTEEGRQRNRRVEIAIVRNR
jgi:outer membrane protein OmpA-like peptidoglycan-associated protein